MPLLEVKNVKKIYSTRFSGNRVTALTDVNLSVDEGEFVAIMGESGSGKTTLLNIIAAMDDATSGEVFLNGTNIKDIKENKLAEFRRKKFGFVFQEFNLLDTFSIGDNIRLPLVLDDRKAAEIDDKVIPLASKLGIKEIRYAENGKAALEVMDEWRPDIVLTDMWMPIMDGTQLAEAMHREPFAGLRS